MGQIHCPRSTQDATPAAATLQGFSSADVVCIAGAAASVDDVVVVEADNSSKRIHSAGWQHSRHLQHSRDHTRGTHLRPQVAAAGHGPSAADQPPASVSAAAGVWSTTVSATQGESGTTARQVQLGLASGPGKSVFEAAAQVPVPAAAGAAATVVVPTCVHRSMSSPGMQLQTQDSIQGLEACAPSVVALPVSCLRPPGLPGLAAWPGLSVSSITSAPSVMIKPMKKSYKPQKMQQLEREVSQARERNKQLKAQLAQLQAEVATASARLGTMRQQYEQQQETNKRLRMEMSYAKDMVAALRQRAPAAGLCT